MPQVIKVRCPFCGLNVDPRRFERGHTLDFSVLVFGGRANMKFLALPNPPALVYNWVMRAIKTKIETLAIKFGVSFRAVSIPFYETSQALEGIIGTAWR